MTVKHISYFKKKIADINRIVDADEEQRQLIALQSVNEELKEIQESFCSAIKEISMLGDFLDRSLSTENFIINAKEAIHKIRLNYAKDQSDQSVKQGRHFADLKDASEHAMKAMTKALIDAKEMFKQNNLASCDSPAILKARLIPTASNKQTLLSYEEKYTNLSVRIETMDTKEFINNLSELKVVCDEIEAIFKTFETDYPDFVNEFFESLKINRNKIKLSDLSPEQFNWLKENGLASQYNVSNG